MVDNLELTKISVENNSKMFTLAQSESKRLLARNKYSELKKRKTNIETRMESLKDLKYKVQGIMTEKNEKPSDIDVHAEQLEERMSQFDAVISSLERGIQLLADCEECNSRRKKERKKKIQK